MQKSLKQLIKERFLGPQIEQNGGNSESLLRRNVLVTNSNISNKSSIASSSFKSSFLIKSQRAAACNTKSSFQNRCDVTQEDTDEHLDICNHKCVKIEAYSMMPKTIFNELVVGVTQAKNANEQKSNQMTQLITSVPQSVIFNRSSNLSSNSNSPYRNNSSDKSSLVEESQDNGGEIVNDGDSCQEDIIEFLQSDTHKMHLIQTLQSLQYVKNYLQPFTDQCLITKRIRLPPFRKTGITKTIIFDLDETLVHCVEDFYNSQCDHLITVQFPNGDRATAGLNIRPYARECLLRAREMFQIVVFTASHQSYADVVLNLLDPTNEIFEMRLYRDSCVKTNDGVYVKDLRIFENCRKMEDLIIVDNAVYSFGYQLENGIPIIPFYDDKEDEELLHLTQYLECLVKNGGDVREHNRKAFQLRELQDLDVQQFLSNMLSDANNYKQAKSQQKSPQKILKKHLKVKTQAQWEFLNVDSDIINEESNEEDESALQESKMMKQRISNLTENYSDKEEDEMKFISNLSVLDKDINN